MAGTTVETAIRVLSQLKKQGIITSSRGSTTIAKPDQLQRLAGS
jgi:DNA-binding transcriptional regulator YhcF (GntR family)